MRTLRLNTKKYMHIIYLLTGSNIGDSGANLQAASKYIHQQIGEVGAVSNVYQSEPWGKIGRAHV